MPLYEYRCTKCGHRFEKIQSFSSTPETECPECHGVLERPLTAPALQFKGAGWYVNDYAGKSSASAPNSDGSKSSSDAAKDAKPATTDSAATGASTASTTESSAKSSTPTSSASPT